MEDILKKQLMILGGLVIIAVVLDAFGLRLAYRKEKAIDVEYAVEVVPKQLEEGHVDGKGCEEAVGQGS